jgi:hypothetical protein
MSNPEIAALQAEIRRKDAVIQRQAEEIQALKARSSDDPQSDLLEAVVVFNAASELVRDAGILRGRELAKLVTRASESIKAAKSPTEKLQLIFAFIKQLLAKIREALKTRPPTDQGVIRQAITKIQLRALAIVDHIRTLAEGRKEISLNSSQARQYLAGREGRPPSRRDAIRALRRAERLCPALTCGHTPGDGRQTMRLTARAEDLKYSEIIREDRERDRRQRFRMDEIRTVFFKEGVF